MKKFFRTYKFELRPTDEQILLLNKHFGCTRYVYNHFLNERMSQYSSGEKSDNYNIQSSKLTQLKKRESMFWLTEVGSNTLQQSLRHLDVAYTNFFKGITKFPKFKSRKNKNSFTTLTSINIKERRLHIQKFREGIKVIISREIFGKISKCTISKTTTNKYFVSLLLEEEIQPSIKTGNICGVDLGIKDFAITSDGIRFENNRYTKKYENKLSKSQKYLSRKIKGSNSFEKQKRKVSLIHEKIVNSRTDTLHKISRELVLAYDVIAIEDLNIKGMIKNHKLAKHISDAGWGTFVGFLEYKAAWNDKKIVKVNRFFPSSKTCCECGDINKNLSLKDRVWTCKNGHTLDRDINAARNILKEGIKILTSAGTVENTSGDLNKTLFIERKSMNLET